MKRILFLILAGALLSAGAAPAAAGQLSGVDIKLNQVFKLDYFNLRIRKVRWVPGSSPLAQAAGSGDGGTGALVLTIEARNAGTDASSVPTLAIQAMFKSGFQTDSEGRIAYDAQGHDLSGDYQPGDGPTMYSVIPHVPKPTAANPVTKIVFTPSYSGEEGPQIFRLFLPPVAIDQK